MAKGLKAKFRNEAIQTRFRGAKTKLANTWSMQIPDYVNLNKIFRLSVKRDRSIWVYSSSLSEYFDVGQIKQPTTWENLLIFIRKDIYKLHLTRND